MKPYYEVLEYHLIKHKLMSFASTSYAKEVITNLDIIYDKDELQRQLQISDEALRIIQRFGACPLSGIHNVKEYIIKASKKGVLQIEELYRIGSNIEHANAIKKFKEQLPFNDCALFNDYADSLVYFLNIKKQIDSCIAPSLEIVDHATPRLSKIRKEMHSLEKELRAKLDHFIATKGDYLSETLITTRNDRLVVPIKATYKYTFGGIVHDESQSGQTVFVEPDFAIEINAKITRLKQNEHEEIVIILRMLSDLIYNEYELLLANENVFGQLDFMFAKGHYAKELNGKIAQISDQQIICFKHARHPLIDPRQVVANDIILGATHNSIMLVSGPNTGGKTVYLKSAGLLTLMHQSGLAIPVDGEAKVGMFNSFYVDIGDEQSIEQSLSTFSSHMQKIIYFMNHINDKSLILIDELGGGTDPKEGEALAMAILEKIHHSHAISLITTHYSNLKTFAIDTKYITNASMLFDEEKIMPLYQIVLDIPGKSYALEISKRLGMPEQIISRANYFKDYYGSLSEKLIEKLEQELLLSNEKYQELVKREDEIKASEIKTAALYQEIEQLEKDIYDNAQKQIEELVLKANLEIDEIVETLKNRSPDDIKMHEWIEAKGKVKEYLASPLEEQTSEVVYNIGDYVKVKSVNKIGMIIRKQGDKYTINLSGLSLVVNTSDLEKAKKEKEKNSPLIGSSSGIKNARYELNIIGLRVEEAMPLIIRHLDDALTVHLTTVRIVHGFGTGALRSAVHEYLKKCRFVEQYRLGGAMEGGGGATIVTLKK